jgi:hypothetical protein
VRWVRELGEDRLGRTSLEARRESMTSVPVRALRSAERCPVNLALEASRLPMAFPTRVDAAIPGENGGMIWNRGVWGGEKWRNSPMPNGMVFKTEEGIAILILGDAARR